MFQTKVYTPPSTQSVLHTVVSVHLQKFVDQRDRWWRTNVYMDNASWSILVTSSLSFLSWGSIYDSFILQVQCSLFVLSVEEGLISESLGKGNCEKFLSNIKSYLYSSDMMMHYLVKWTKSLSLYYTYTWLWASIDRPQKHPDFFCNVSWLLIIDPS